MTTATPNNPVPTIADLMAKADANWRVFDMGRRIQSINKNDFAVMERGEKPYPYPLQQKARFAVLFWDQKESKQAKVNNPFIWFLQFDVDELGLLNLQQRDHFISIVIKELGSAIVGNNDSSSEKLDNHPYSFTPDQNKQASFNAKVKVALKQPASMYYEHVQSYFNNEISTDKWQELTVQGIADFAARIEDTNNESNLIAKFDELTVQILSVLGGTLEHSTISTLLTTKLIEQQNIALDSSDHEEVFHLLRCMAGSEAKGLVKEQLSHLLAQPDLNEESLYLIIAGRFWDYLNDPELLNLYFDKVAQHSNQQLFAGIFADLVAVPATRASLLGLLRDPNRTAAVSRSIGTLFGNQ